MFNSTNLETKMKYVIVLCSMLTFLSCKENSSDTVLSTNERLNREVPIKLSEEEWVERENFIEKIKSDFAVQRKRDFKAFDRILGRPAWNQAVVLKDALVLPVVSVSGDIIDFTHILFVVESEGVLKYHVQKVENITVTHNGNNSIIEIYHLGFTNYFENKLFGEVSCHIFEKLINAIEIQYPEARTFDGGYTRDKCRQVFQYDGNCILFLSISHCNEELKTNFFAFAMSAKIEF